MEIRVKVARYKRKGCHGAGGSSTYKQRGSRAQGGFTRKRFRFMPSYYNVFPARLGEGAEPPSGDSRVSLQRRRDLLTVGRDPLG
jgi:hypothetical protein